MTRRGSGVQFPHGPLVVVSSTTLPLIIVRFEAVVLHDLCRDIRTEDSVGPTEARMGALGMQA